MQLKTFIFNPFQVNTYLLWNNSGNAVIIDPANHNEEENNIIKKFCLANNIKISAIILTHAHIDHILGCNFIKNHFGAEIYLHKESNQFLQTAPSYAEMFGLTVDDLPKADKYLADNDEFEIEDIKFKVIYTPGHADGSICLYNSQQNMLFSGDVLFMQSIGRTDLPTGNHELLINNIKTKLLCLSPETEVFPGHGPSTTIIDEIRHNPFL